MLTTPAAITPEIRSLCQRLGCTSKPVFVAVKTHRESAMNDCFGDVDKQRRDHGGDSVIGWQIWEWPKVMIEAELHAIWRSPDGKLVDVSLKTEGEKQILFVPDPARIYTGKKVDNVRVAIWDNPLVHELIQVSEDLFQGIVDCYGADYVGKMRLSGRLASLGAVAPVPGIMRRF